MYMYSGEWVSVQKCIYMYMYYKVTWPMSHTHLQSFQYESHHNPRYDQQIANDGCCARKTEKITQEEAKHHFSMTPEEEGEN